MSVHFRNPEMREDSELERQAGAVEPVRDDGAGHGGDAVDHDDGGEHEGVAAGPHPNADGAMEAGVDAAAASLACDNCPFPCVFPFPSPGARDLSSLSLSQLFPSRPLPPAS